MNCTEVNNQLFLYIDNELSAPDQRKIEAHLKVCHECEQAYEHYLMTHLALIESGKAYRAGRADNSPLPMRDSLMKRFKTPIPLWVPLATSVLVAVILAVAFASLPDREIKLGKEKRPQVLGVISPPLAAEAMLAFIIAPTPSSPGRLSASIKTVETYLLSYPDDLSMHTKLVELYRAKLLLQSTSSPERTVLAEKLSIEQKQVQKFLKKGDYVQGGETNEK